MDCNFDVDMQRAETKVEKLVTQTQLVQHGKKILE